MQEKTEINTSHPDLKLTIVGGGLIGLLEAYFAYTAAKKRNERVRITVIEKNSQLSDSTVMNLVPSLTPDEIIAVVPRGEDLSNKLKLSFKNHGGIRVDDVANVNHSPAAQEFIQAVENYKTDEKATLLQLGKMSMDQWVQIYTEADDALKSIFRQANFNPCRERQNTETRLFNDGYRIDLINIPGAQSKAQAMQAEYQSLGYTDCKTLTPKEVITLNPHLSDFCRRYSTLNEQGELAWCSDAMALWRPGGYLNTQIFLPLFYDYLKEVMGQYVNDAGITKDCFRYRPGRRVDALHFQDNVINGVIYNNSVFKQNKHPYAFSHFALCPGEAVGSLKKWGLKEPAYARFAGASLQLSVPISTAEQADYAQFEHGMEVHLEGVALAWQGRLQDGKLYIGVAGTKAFYGDVEPCLNEEFQRNRNLLQLNIINSIMPAIVSKALKKQTLGVELGFEDLDQLIQDGLAKCWVGSRAVAYDGFPTLGAVFKANTHQVVQNAHTTTQLGSGGASFGPACVSLSQKFGLFKNTPSSEFENLVMAKASSAR